MGQDSNILFIAPSLVAGGAELAMARLVRRLAPDLDRLRVLSFAPGDGLERSLPGSVQHHCLGLDLAKGSLDWALLPSRVDRFLRSERPDVVVSLLTYGHWAAGLAASPPMRWIAWEQCHLSPEVSHQRYARIKRWWLKRLLPRAERVIAVSDGVRDDLTQSWGVRPERITVLPNLVERASVARARKAPPPHPWLLQDVPVLAFVGRLAPQKNLLFLLEAFALAARRRPLRLLLVGEGPERPRIEARVRELGLADSVRLVGAVQDPLPYLAHASGLVLPSLWEGFSNVTLEAMSCGTPVAAADCPGPNELLMGGKCGLLLPAGDREAWSLAMTRLGHDSSLRERLARAGERRAEDFSPESIVPRFLRILCPAQE